MTTAAEVLPTVDDIVNHLHGAFGDPDLISTDTGETVASLDIDMATNLVTARDPEACEGRPLAYFRLKVEEIPLATGPQTLDADGNAPSGSADIEPGAPVSRDGRTGLVVRSEWSHNLARGDAELFEVAPAPVPLPGPEQGGLWLAVAWGAPADADLDDLDSSYERTWVPAEGTVAQRTWYPEIES